MRRDTATWEPTVSVRLVQPVLLGLRGLNLDVDEVLRHVGLTADILADLTRRIPLPVANRLWEYAAERSGDPGFALITAAIVPPGLYDVAEYAARKHRTLGEGLRVFARFTGLLHDVLRIRFVEESQWVTMVYEMLDGVPPPAVWAEHVLAAFVLVGRQVTDWRWAPVAVHFVHASRGDPQRFEDVLGVKPEFEQRHNALLIPRAAWDRATVDADPRLAGILHRYAEAMLQRHGRGAALARRVQESLAAELYGGDVTIEAVAKRLDLPVRVLRRRLREEGTSHRQILDDLRCRLATRYLRDGRWSTEEVAFLTGFSATSAFIRAFRRWTGQTVAEYRQ